MWRKLFSVITLVIFFCNSFTHIQGNITKNINVTDFVLANLNITKGFVRDAVTELNANAESSFNIQKVKPKSSSEIPTSAISSDGSIMGGVSVTNNNISIIAKSSSDLNWLMNLYNLHLWNAHFIPAVGRLSVPCSSAMRTFILALESGDYWATKMSDASGRYSSQFFFGNDFWLGSRTECKELHNEHFNKFPPPFQTHFYVVKMVIKLHQQLTPKGRLLSMGLCLPQDCSTSEIKDMLQEEARTKVSKDPPRSVDIVSVRAVPGSYSLMLDKKLHLVLVILCVVILLMIIGSCYEMSLESKYKRNKGITSNNNESDVNINSSFKKFAIENGIDEKKEPVFSKTCPGGKSVSAEVLLSFSAVSNSRKILYCGSNGEDSLTCVHGLRFISLAWVIMVHTYLQVFTIAENKSLRSLAERKFMFQTVSNATFSVDTFFFISGLLVTYLYFNSAKKEMAQRRSKQQTQQPPTGIASVTKFFKLMGYRFIRLTPAYMFVLLIAEISMRWLHNISVFEPISQNHVSCDKYWWRNILYINSLFPMKDMCMLWSWYVSNDTQFYLLGVIILLLSVRHFRFASVMLIFFMIASWCITIFISVHLDYRAKIEDPFLRFDELYDKPWTRLGPYLVGMFTGWFIFKTKAKFTLSKMCVTIGWILSLSTLFFLVYGLHIYPLGLIGSALYVSVGHSAWAIALGWIVVACCSGYGGYMNSLLSCKLVFPLSRLTYCAYLVHPIVMTVTNFQMNAPLHLQDAIIVVLYLGNILASFFLSFFISLLFEAPVVRLLKIMFAPKKSKPTDSSAYHQTNL